MKTWILIILMLGISACGGEEGAPEENPGISASPGTPSGGSSGSGTSGGSGNGSPGDFCHTALPVYWCDDASGSSAGAVHSQISDTEPNNDLANAVPVHWPRNNKPDQRIGFGVEGSVNGTSDLADFFAFTPQQSADFYISLCDAGRHCGPWSTDDRLSVASASVRILDQFGTEVFSATLNPGSANAFETRFESGVLYYAAVVAEGGSTGAQPYLLIVGESLQQTVEDEPSRSASAPEAPELSAFIVDSQMNVQLDWTIPTYNEDSTQVTDLAGFKLYLYDYVREGDAAERRLVETINDRSATTRTLNLDGFQDWYVSITAFDASGRESAHSNGVELTSTPE